MHLFRKHLNGGILYSETIEVYDIKVDIYSKLNKCITFTRGHGYS